jgi:hypothetical protein
LVPIYTLSHILFFWGGGGSSVGASPSKPCRVKEQIKKIFFLCNPKNEAPSLQKETGPLTLLSHS